MKRFVAARKLVFLAALATFIPGAAALAQDTDPLGGFESVETVQGSRVALVIGNSVYARGDRWAELPNAAKDVEAVSAQLALANFTVIPLAPNATKAQIETALRLFAERAASAEVAMFYYAGHGFQYEGENYLVPTDAPDATTVSTLPFDFVPVSMVVKANAARTLKIFVFDACRVPGPVVKDTGGTRGDVNAGFFGTINLPQSVILYSTSPGAKAYDWYETNGQRSSISPFARAFTTQIATPGLPLTEVLFRTKATTQGLTRTRTPKQSPQDTNDVAKRFYFTPPMVSDVQVIAVAGGRAGPSSPGGVVPAAPAAKTLPVLPATKPLSLSPQELSTKDPTMLVRLALLQQSPDDIARLASTGDVVGLLIYGLMLHHGIGAAEDIPRSWQLLERAAASDLVTKAILAQLRLRDTASSTSQRVQALAMLRSASDAGGARAQSYLAWLLARDSTGLVPRDSQQAVRLWQAAAAQGHVYSTFVLYTENGYDRTAANLAQIAARGNLDGSDGLCQLGYLYHRVASNIVACQQAADAGYGRSQAILALAYARGDGIDKSSNVARDWARLAYRQPEVLSWTDLRASLTEIMD